VDDATIARLYQEWGPLVYRRCLRILHDEAEAEDALQEVFTRFLRAAHRYEERGKMLNFLYRMATNHCLNLLRARKAAPALVADGRDELPNHRDPADRAAIRDSLRTMFGSFDERSRLIIFLHAADGMTQEEIATVTGISRKTIGRKLARFRARLDEMLRDFR